MKRFINSSAEHLRETTPQSTVSTVDVADHLQNGRDGSQVISYTIRRGRFSFTTTTTGNKPWYTLQVHSKSLAVSRRSWGHSRRV